MRKLFLIGAFMSFASITHSGVVDTQRWPGRIVLLVQNNGPADSQKPSATMVTVKIEYTLVMDDKSAAMCSGGPYSINVKYVAEPIDEKALKALGYSLDSMFFMVKNMNVAWALYQQGKPVRMRLANSGEFSAHIESSLDTKLKNSFKLELWNSADEYNMASYNFPICD